MLKQNKGITLIALVITIIVMMILVAVTVTVALNGGLFNTAKDAGGRTQKEADKETLTSMVIGAYDNTTYSISKEKLTQNLKSANWGLSDGETEGDVTYLKCKSPNGNAFKVNLTTGAIEEDNGINVKFTISDLNEPDIKHTNEDLVTIDMGDTEFSDGSEVVSITPISEGIDLVEGEEKKFNIKQNGTYKFKLVDSNGNETEISITINCFDKEGPKVKIELPSLECYMNSKVKAKVTITDEGSGVDLGNCKWVINQTATGLGTDKASLFTGGNITSEQQEIETAPMTKKGDYYLHVLATDKVGNTIEFISDKITVIHAYVITTPQEFQNMKNDLAGNYIIGNDIDMTGFEFTTINGYFSGTIDGKGQIFCQKKENR